MSAAETKTPDPLIGQVLSGLYKVERLVGEGGMGCVYEATHVHLKKSYAVKVLSEARAGSPAAAERFLREAKAASMIEHDNIAKVVNFDTDTSGRVFIVMELIEGPSLADVLRDGPMKESRACDIAGQVGSALQAAHDAGVLHRDLKPDNVILANKNGRECAKVLDFGISKLRSPEQTDVKLTATDQILGTPLYISPELARGASHIDHRADVYALGAMLYEMLTGQPPFIGENQFQLLFMHGSETPVPPGQRATDREISPHVERAVLRALEKEPRDRFDSMRDFAAALVQTKAPIAPASSPWRLTALGAALVGVTAVAVDRVEIPKLAHGQTANRSVKAPPATVRQGKKSADAPPSTGSVAADVVQTEVKVTSRPTGAVVRINNEVVGRTPFRGHFSVGEQLVFQWTHPGYRPAQSRQRVTEGLSLHKNLSKRVPESPQESPIKLDF